MDLLTHFLQENKDITILNLKSEERDTLLAKLPLEFKRCYIADIDLEKRVEHFSSTKENELNEILPSEGNIKSGDFGEIFSYFLFKDRYRDIYLDGPRKWIWKQEKNVAAPYSDVILFSCNSVDTPSIDDLLVSVESKMKATHNKDYHPIQNAIEGAKKDYTTRIATSLSWLRKKYKEESLKAGAPVDKFVHLVKVVERFIKSETIGEYKKKVKAIAIVDEKFLKDEAAKKIVIPSEIGSELEIYVVSIVDLKAAYEETYDKIRKL